MSLTPGEASALREVFQFIYAELWCHYRGLLAVLGQRGIVVSEHLETDVAQWVRDHRETAGNEALDRLQRFFERQAERDQ